MLLNTISQESLQEKQEPEMSSYPPLYPGFQERDHSELQAVLAAHNNEHNYQDADERQPLTSESQQDTPQHMVNQMMVTPAVSHSNHENEDFFFTFCFSILSSLLCTIR